MDRNDKFQSLFIIWHNGPSVLSQEQRPEGRKEGFSKPVQKTVSYWKLCRMRHIAGRTKGLLPVQIEEPQIDCQDGVFMHLA